MINAQIDPDLQAAVDEYLFQLRRGDFESAFHGLVELDKSIVHSLIAAYHNESSPDVRKDLFYIIGELRTPLALPLLEEVLRDRNSSAWKEALDGLVALGSAEGIRLLEKVLGEESLAATPDPEYTRWVVEAIEQTKEVCKRKTFPG